MEISIETIPYLFFYIFIRTTTGSKLIRDDGFNDGGPGQNGHWYIIVYIGISAFLKYKLEYLNFGSDLSHLAGTILSQIEFYQT